ncbi:MAG: hypothetical protein MZV70_63380 [Desulfobacterales bacterium]|nr:hypothetical protein [Desulfobacterales bacterium]
MDPAALVGGERRVGGGVPVGTLREIESGQGLVELGEIEALARAIGMTLPALRVPPGQTEAERVVLALLEGEG